MNCPMCGENLGVRKTTSEGNTIKRERVCPSCGILCETTEMITLMRTRRKYGDNGCSHQITFYETDDGEIEPGTWVWCRRQDPETSNLECVKKCLDYADTDSVQVVKDH